MKLKYVTLALIILLSYFISCNTIEPNIPIRNSKIDVELIDVSCYEAWINLKTSNISLPATIYFKLDTIDNGGLYLYSRDTLLYFNYLLAGAETKLKISTSNHFQSDSTYEINFRTLDTTQENYSLHLDTLGSTQSDITGIWGTSNNNLWAVGTFTSSGLTYALAHFDGSNWRYIFPNEFHNSDGIGSGDLEGIFGLDENNIWVVGYRHTPFDSIHSFVGYYNGSIWKNLKVNVPDVIFTDLWVDENKNVWVVGTGGTIMFYDGVNWIQQNSGTNFTLWDIDGIKGDNIYATGYSSDHSEGIMLHFNGNNWKKEQEEHFDIIGPVTGVCAISERKVWGIGNTTASIFNGKGWRGYEGLIEDVLLVVKGQSYNDIFFGGFEGAINHFNGIRINKINNTIIGHENSLIKDIFILGNKVYFAGRGGIGFDQRGLVYTMSK